ncbi:hypothetical protein SLITK23_75740 [Streptomyces lividans]|uniref:Uncharacterized protein n=1 Tax=Streptomyces violaceolatus TaxID=67378 RepID=A0ABN3TCR4_9ACTN|nr:hypothetical protein SLITK23_00130 [Streptomyces lividans]BDE44329.1 hypothetical protein SLITK23_75740 [Streptomyces lividans]
MVQQDLGGGAVAAIRAGDHHAQQQAEGVDHDVPPAPVDLGSVFNCHVHIRSEARVTAAS